MRIALREFLSSLEKAYSQHVGYLNTQLASFEYPFSSFRYPEDVIQLLYELTLHVEEPRHYASREWEEGLGLGVGFVGERFERIFGKDCLPAYERAKTGVDGGIRGVVEKYFEGYTQESVRSVLFPIIHSFFEVEYGWFPDYDYAKVHADGYAYLKAHRTLLPDSVLQEAKTNLMGTKVGNDGSMHPYLYEVYTLHPTLTR